MRRAASAAVSPRIVYVRRNGAPTSPANTRPWLTPARSGSGGESSNDGAKRAKHPLLVVLGRLGSAGDEDDPAAVGIDVGLEEAHPVAVGRVLDGSDDLLDGRGRGRRVLRRALRRCRRSGRTRRRRCGARPRRCPTSRRPAPSAARAARGRAGSPRGAAPGAATPWGRRGAGGRRRAGRRRGDGRRRAPPPRRSGGSRPRRPGPPSRPCASRPGRRRRARGVRSRRGRTRRARCGCRRACEARPVRRCVAGRPICFRSARIRNAAVAARGAWSLAVVEEEERVAAELQQPAAVAVRDVEEPGERRVHHAVHLLRTRTPERREPLRHPREPGDVDEDERALDPPAPLERRVPHPLQRQPRHIRAQLRCSAR